MAIAQGARIVCLCKGGPFLQWPLSSCKEGNTPPISDGVACAQPSLLDTVSLGRDNCCSSAMDVAIPNSPTNDRELISSTLPINTSSHNGMRPRKQILCGVFLPSL